MYECDGNFNTENSLQYKLLIEIGGDYYSYAVIDAGGKLKAISYKNVPLLTNLENEDVLKLAYKNTLISLNTTHFTFIPTTIYNQKPPTLFTQFIDNAPIDTVFTHTLLNNQITALNTYNQNQLEAIQNVFPSANICPQYLPFVESTCTQFKAILGTQLFLNLQLNYLELLILHDGKLQFYNVFNCLNNDEMLYYTLLACQKNNIKPQNLTLRVCGKINSETAAYQQLNAIYTDIRIAKTNAIYVNSAEFKNIEPHKFFSLLSLIICE